MALPFPVEHRYLQVLNEVPFEGYLPTRSVLRGAGAARTMNVMAVSMLAAALAGPASAQESEILAETAGVTRAPKPDPELGRGTASWYGPKLHGRRTSSGERFDMNELTAAHRTLPFGTRLRVRNEGNGREVVVRINDRLPRMPGRIIDVSKAAAAALGFIQTGEAAVVLIGIGRD